MHKSSEPDSDREFALDANDVHVWTIDLKSYGCDAFRQVLSPDEQQIAGRFRFAKDRDAFNARRLARRQILSRYVGQAPQELTFESNEWGKPRLSGPGLCSELEFNTSSSRDLAVIAVSRNLPLGVDVEFEDPQIDFLSVAACFCAAADLRALHVLPESARCKAFYRLWTQTEALGKAIGHGLSRELPCTVPDCRSQRNAAPFGESVACRTHGTWWFLPLELSAPENVATLCCSTERCRVRYFAFRVRT